MYAMNNLFVRGKMCSTFFLEGSTPKNQRMPKSAHIGGKKDSAKVTTRVASPPRSSPARKTPRKQQTPSINSIFTARGPDFVAEKKTPPTPHKKPHRYRPGTRALIEIQTTAKTNKPFNTKTPIRSFGTSIGNIY